MDFIDSVKAPRIKSLHVPTDPDDVVRLGDLAHADGAGLMSPGDHARINTVAWEPIRTATTAALPAATLAAGILTADANGDLPAMDGVQLSAGDRVLVQHQANAAQNGIYVVEDVGSASAPWSLKRAEDASAVGNFSLGKILRATEGTDHENKVFRCMTPLVDVDTTPIEFGEYILAKEGTTKAIEVEIVGDGVWTEKDVPHGFATTRVQVVVWDAAGRMVLAGVKRKDENTVTIVTGEPVENGVKYYVTVTCS